jgi:hypothetical protein
VTERTFRRNPQCPRKAFQRISSVSECKAGDGVMTEAVEEQSSSREIEPDRGHPSHPHILRPPVRDFSVRPIVVTAGL